MIEETKALTWDNVQSLIDNVVNPEFPEPLEEVENEFPN